MKSDYHLIFFPKIITEKVYLSIEGFYGEVVEEAKTF